MPSSDDPYRDEAVASGAVHTECEECDGVGEIDGVECEECEGSGEWFE